MKKIFLIIFIVISWNTSSMAECIEGDCKKGVGTFETKDFIYKGEFKNSDFHGEGIMTYPPFPKASYAGTWKNGRPNGYGVQIDSNGGKYEGEWKMGKRHGQGSMNWSNGDKYIGNWKNDKIDGVGDLVLIEGKKYSGEFKKDKYHGQGTMTLKDGKVIKGLWKKGNFIK